MPTETIIVIAGVIATFVVFAAVLAWGDGQTRQSGKDRMWPAE